MIDLLRCPFCDSAAVFIDSRPQMTAIYVACERCAATGPAFRRDAARKVADVCQSAADAWNKRQPSPKVATISQVAKKDA